MVDGRLLPRFPFHQPGFFTWDFRAAKGVTLATRTRLQFIFEVFNLLNTTNLGTPNAVAGAANFGTALVLLCVASWATTVAAPSLEHRTV